FGCGVGGDVFKFIELQERLGFQDVVRFLARKFGLALPEVSEQDDDARRDAAAREALLKVHELAAAYFRGQLGSPSGGRARQQIERRALTAATIEQLGIGYAPNSRDALKTHLLKQGIPEPLLLQSGLVVRRDNGDVIDRFRNRLIIPIRRETGSVIAFG